MSAVTDSLFDAPPVYDGKSNMEYQPPGTAEWKSRAYEHIQKLEEAVKTACDLIWNQDAFWIEGGAQRLDDWVGDYGELVGFKTSDDE